VSRSIPRGLSLALALIALAFGVVGVILLIGLASTYSSWRATSAVVESITFRPVGSDPHGFVFVDFRYESPRGEELTHASQPLLPGRDGRFAREYAVGTHHVISVDPLHPQRADLPATLDNMLGPLFPWIVCLLLLFVARHFWRFEGSR
jgi:hypothetical protein